MTYENWKSHFCLLVQRASCNSALWFNYNGFSETQCSREQAEGNNIQLFFDLKVLNAIYWVRKEVELTFFPLMFDLVHLSTLMTRPCSAGDTRCPASYKFRCSLPPALVITIPWPQRNLRRISHIFNRWCNFNNVFEKERCFALLWFCNKEVASSNPHPMHKKTENLMLGHIKPQQQNVVDERIAIWFHISEVLVSILGS